MPRGSRTRAVLACMFLASVLHAADCVQDNRTDKKAGIVVADFSITGTQTLGSDELNRIVGELTGSCFDDDSDEMGERVRAFFQDRGYFTAEVKTIHLKPLDPLGIPKPVKMEAEVIEGPRYKVEEITFVNNHAFGADKLRQEFPLKAGDWFERGKVASGLQGLRKLYGTDGFLDWMAIPETRPGSNAVMNLQVSLEEGPQYHMGKLGIIADKELGNRLQVEWKLTEGEVYDNTYIDQFIETNRDLLPAEFGPKDIVVTKNCPTALVDVRLVLDASKESGWEMPKNVLCEDKGGQK